MVEPLTRADRAPLENAGFRYRERVGAAHEGKSVLDYLADRYRHSSEASWRERIEAGRVRLDGEVVTPKTRLVPGRELCWHRPPWREPEAPSSFAVLHRDDDVLAVAKPKGLQAMPGAGFLERTLLRRVGRAFPGATPLHRLGRGTSGITLFARTPDSRRSLTSAWQEGRVLRRYRALVSGRLPFLEATLDHPIGFVAHPLLGEVAARSPSGKRAASHCRLVEHREESSLVEVTLDTGRTHQIRIHLAACGHPLVGDRLYRAGGTPDPGTRTLPGELGYHLHAHEVRFPRPRASGDVTIECQPPALLREGAR